MSTRWSSSRHSDYRGSASLWTLSATVSSEYISAMQDLAHLPYTLSPQHKDSIEARIEIDVSDLEKMQTKIKTCSPYTTVPTLINSVNGIVAGSEVNMHAFHEVGNKIIRGMIGKSAFAHKFKREDKAAKTLENNSAVKIAKDRAIDPGCVIIWRSFP
ncbi:hypothetical protein DPMN_055259 [Dreissena polymorpha]|uniref:Uncharacterized protein n=1 Tax=Dreissena polymorpha TaxID=45954 RepID=A0A9D4CSC7_DREPO|nr:hypothetical protein DPMN_055259 [Dreissena polymorpha]